MTRKLKHPRRGMVLVMALVLIGVAGLVLAGLANRSLSLALEARTGAVALQQKWATLSPQALLLRDPERLLGDLAASFEAQQAGWPTPPRAGGACQLGEFTVRIVLADEQAKTSLNVLYDQRPDQVAAMLAEAAHAAGSLTPLRLRPAIAAERERTKRSFRHWGQVVDLAQLGRRARELDGLRLLSSELTCWGGGRLNLTRASDASLDTVARLVLNGPETQRLLEARDGFQGEVRDLLRLAGVPRRKSAKLRRLLTDRSGCYSLWVETEHRGQTRLAWAVSEPGRRDAPGVRVYSWP